MRLLIGWLQDRLGLCNCRPYHLALTWRKYFGGRYCMECWLREMTNLPLLTKRRWDIEVRFRRVEAR